MSRVGYDAAQDRTDSGVHLSTRDTTAMILVEEALTFWLSGASSTAFL